MVNVVIRLIRVLPILAVVGVAVALLYGLLCATSTKERARRILIRVLSVVNGALAIVFALATAYAWFEGNVYVLEVVDVTAALFAIVFVIVRLVAWRTGSKGGTGSKGQAR